MKLPLPLLWLQKPEIQQFGEYSKGRIRKGVALLLFYAAAT